MATSGSLQLTVVDARLTRDTETFGKMDPYVKIQTRHQNFRTKTKNGAGKTPVWNETFTVDVKYIGDDLTMQVYDEDPGADDIVGQACIKLSAFCTPGGIDEWYQIAHNGRSSGQVHIKALFKPAGQGQAAQQQPMMQPGMMPMQQPGMPMQQPMMQPGMQPGMMPQQPMMQPGMQQPMMQPGMMPPQRPGMMQPGMMPMQQPGMMQPGMPMQQPMMQPGMPMQQPMMQPGMQMQQPMMQPGMMPMQQPMMQPGMVVTRPPQTVVITAGGHGHKKKHKKYKKFKKFKKFKLKKFF